MFVGVSEKVVLSPNCIDRVTEYWSLQCPLDQRGPLEALVTAKSTKATVAQNTVNYIKEAHTTSLAAYLAFKADVY